MSNPYFKFMGGSDIEPTNDLNVNAAGAGKYEQTKTDLARNPNPDNWRKFAAAFAQIDAMAD